MNNQPMSEIDVVHALQHLLARADLDERSCELVPNPNLPGSALLEITRPNGIVDAYSLTVVSIS